MKPPPAGMTPDQFRASVDTLNALADAMFADPSALVQLFGCLIGAAVGAAYEALWRDDPEPVESLSDVVCEWVKGRQLPDGIPGVKIADVIPATTTDHPSPSPSPPTEDRPCPDPIADALDLDTWTETVGTGRRWRAGRSDREFRLIFWPDSVVVQMIDWGPPTNPVSARADNCLSLWVTDPDGRRACRELEAGLATGADLADWLKGFHPVVRRGGWVAAVVTEFLADLS